MTKYVLSAVAGTYVLLAMGFTASYTWQYSADLSLVALIPNAVEHGYTWPMWLFELDHLALMAGGLRRSVTVVTLDTA